MNKAAAALYSLMSQMFEKPDEATLITNGKVFRHAAATPLTGLLLDLELAYAHQQNPYLYSALLQAQRLRTLFEQASTSKGKAQLFGVATAVEEVMQLARSRFRSTLCKTHCVVDNGSRLKGNRFLFQETLLCAITNAVESYHSHQQRLVLLSAHETTTHVTISVTDGGQGFNRLQKTLAFAEGFSLKPHHQGLGLTCIKKIVTHHFGGQIKIMSKPQRGTTLLLTFPK